LRVTDEPSRTDACGLSGCVVQFTQAADKAVAAGFMVQSDRDIAVDKAKNAPIPK